MLVIVRSLNAWCEKIRAALPNEASRSWGSGRAKEYDLSIDKCKDSVALKKSIRELQEPL
jgi:hypothetical protein